jgi:predicted anti-sigma-YlaC factor YlaD
MMRVSAEKLCNSNLIHAYIDGELESFSHAIFSAHLDECATCRSELRAQQQFICELDSVLANEINVSVPADFSRVVAARAVSDMSGVRSAAENRKALTICLVFGLAGFALLGAASRQLTFGLMQKLFRRIFGLADFVWNTVYDSIASLAVISRVLGRKFIVETGNVTVAIVLLALAVLLLSRLISNYHRAGAMD